MQADNIIAVHDLGVLEGRQQMYNLMMESIDEYIAMQETKRIAYEKNYKSAQWSRSVRTVEDLRYYINTKVGVNYEY